MPAQLLASAAFLCFYGRKLEVWNEMKIGRLVTCQQLLQHCFSLNLLSSFGGLRFDGSLLGLQLCDFFFGLLDLRLLRL